MRFARSKSHVWGHKLVSRGGEPGDFLGRLWAHFGAPDPRDDGFEYSLVDHETGLSLTAYAGASGPSYGGSDAEALRPVVTALEQLLDATQPIDCEHAFTADSEYGGGTWVIGCRNGHAFSESRDDRTPPSAATSYESCVEIAAQRDWDHCIAAVLPDPPDDHGECIGFSIEKNVPCFLYVHGDDSPRPIPLTDLELELSPLARLWLDAFERWKRERPTKQAHGKKSRRRD